MGHLRSALVVVVRVVGLEIQFHHRNVLTQDRLVDVGDHVVEVLGDLREVSFERVVVQVAKHLVGRNVYRAAANSSHHFLLHSYSKYKREIRDSLIVLAMQSE